jgi:hypothetical protein
MEIRDGLQKTHSNFMDQFGEATLQAANTRELILDRVYAKISLVAKMMKEIGSIEQFKEVDLSRATSDYPRSIMLSSNMTWSAIYLLNANGDVVITDSVGMASADPLDARLTLLTDCRKILIKHKDVLSESFDWNKFCEDLLEAIHSSIFDKGEAVKLKIRGKD